MVPRLSHFESSHGPGLKIRLDVSWVQESDTHEEARPGEGPQLPQAERALRVGEKRGDAGYRGASNGPWPAPGSLWAVWSAQAV